MQKIILLIAVFFISNVFGQDLNSFDENGKLISDGGGEARKTLAQTLDKAKYRDLLYLRMQGFKAHEIGGILDLNINTVFSRCRHMETGINALK